jgi:hypothetical protein
MPNTGRVSKEKDVSEAERLDRIERHIQQLADASAALQRELKIARQLAAARRQSVQPHPSAKSNGRRKSR